MGRIKNMNKIIKLTYLLKLFSAFLFIFPMVNSAAIGQPENSGLYNSTDNVLILNYKNFKENLLNKNHSMLIEFYNSFCGHCRRFKPTYVELAKSTYDWRDVIRIAAIDCADDKNNDICRDFEIMGYPSMRYFPPHYSSDEIMNKASSTTIIPSDDDNKQSLTPNKESSRNLGVSGDLYLYELSLLKLFLVYQLRKEAKPEDNNRWPNFSTFDNKNYDDFFDKLPATIKYGILIYEQTRKTHGTQSILDLNRYVQISVRRTRNETVASAFNINFTKIAFFQRSNYENLEFINIPLIIPLQLPSSDDYSKEIKNFLNQKQIYPDEDDGDTSKISDNKESSILPGSYDNDNEILNEVINSGKQIIYQADLEQALHFSIFHEITKFKEISGERLLALQSYIQTVANYNPLGVNGKKFLENIRNYIMDHNREINGQQLNDKIIAMEKKYSPVFSSSRWVGCISSKVGLRGFTCGLWQLFHYMSVQAAENENSTEHLEVLKAVHNYVKYFFGCSECSNHFQEMAKRRKIWSTESKDEAIMFLWAAHNEVNQRLAGDDTEDPKFPKIQFPSRSNCPECYLTSTSVNEINWNKPNVLEFLKRIHSSQNISRFYIDNEKVLLPKFDYSNQKRSAGNVFSEIDMRMGIFLYGFCILMMIIAVKLFINRGYRKKTNSPHNSFMGKV